MPGNLSEVRTVLDAFAAIGADEVQIIPASYDLRKVDLVVEDLQDVRGS